MIEQLSFTDLTLPETKGRRYFAYEDILKVQLQMASGRMVEEIRGKVWVIEYTYDTMTNEMLRELLAILRGAGGFQVAFLPDNSDEPITGTVLCTKQPKPAYAMDHQGEAVWTNVSFTLREVEPHD